jgi:hypothetical protein
MTAADASENGHRSHLDFLRARHTELARDRTLDLDVPGYQGRLVVRYGAVPYATVARSARVLSEPGASADAMFASSADTLIAACREVLYRGEDGELEAIGPDAPYRYDQKLADLLGSATTTARQLVHWLFGGDEAAKVRIGSQAGELVGWLQDVDSETTEALAGE